MQHAGEGVRRKVYFVAFMVTMLPFAFGKAEVHCVTHQLDSEVEVCSQLKGKTKKGKTVRWTLSIPSTDMPVTLRLFNASPTVAKLKGECAGGMVRTSGGARNEARCKVKMIGVGTADLRAWPHLEDPKQNADLTAARIVGGLARCEQDFQARREQLEATLHRRSGRTVYSSEDVEAALAMGEGCVLGALEGLPELAAMADWVRYLFDSARNDLEEIRKASLRAGDSSHAVRAVLKPETRSSAAFVARSRGKPIDAERTDGVLEALYRALGLARNKAEEKKLWIPGLCVLSTPPEARFKMYPPSYPEGVHETTTDGAVVNLSPGIYAYELRKKGEGPITCKPDKKGRYPCGPINLMVDDRATLECDFDNGCKLSMKKTFEECEEENGS